MAFKITSATINETPLSQADPFVKMSVTAILSGMASKASGGDFVQGAMSAMVVWLYNEMGSFDPLFGAPSDMMQPVYKFFDSLFGEKPPSKFEKTVNSIQNGFGKFKDGFSLIRTKYIPEGKKAYNNAHPAAKMSLKVALTITEFGLTKILPEEIQVPYDIYSGSHFETIPTSPAGWFGYFIVALEPLY